MKLWPGPHNRRTFEKVSDANYFSQSRASRWAKANKCVGRRAQVGLRFARLTNRLPRQKADGPSGKWASVRIDSCDSHRLDSRLKNQAAHGLPTRYVVGVHGAQSSRLVVIIGVVAL
jgi:hypothetical protein